MWITLGLVKRIGPRAENTDYIRRSQETRAQGGECGFIYVSSLLVSWELHRLDGGGQIEPGKISANRPKIEGKKRAGRPFFSRKL